MTVIAYDGTTLAADRMMSIGNVGHRGRKIWKHNDHVFAIAGSATLGMEMVRWYKAGADPAKYPPAQMSEDWCWFIVWTGRKLLSYDTNSTPLKYKPTQFVAWGAGREIAIGAMGAGANAVQAVKIANKYHHYCGFGVDWYRTK